MMHRPAITGEPSKKKGGLKLTRLVYTPNGGFKDLRASENSKSFNFCVSVRTVRSIIVQYDQFNYNSVQYEYRRTVIKFYIYRTVRYVYRTGRYC
ncbi:hypothetical protein IEQ34_008261 [Dendrobium chrysotoxum]|uniref:Uncharacterized protein n=1 Tax=Dendrobium chrysotoxum TaxID=161865 RepID=A0AAV7GQG9_DENCH|nr:hypothetical protein IEQ34_008261 [Dendrobium chrysotoxum]